MLSSSSKFKIALAFLSNVKMFFDFSALLIIF